jgi:putative hydrolase of the HAD superfamily
VLDFADAVVLSCAVGRAKPDPHILANALRRLGGDPADALVIDDTPGHVEAASRLGMTGHLHTDAAETARRIETFAMGAARAR